MPEKVQSGHSKDAFHAKKDVDLSEVKRQERAIWQGLLVDLAVFLPILIVALLSRSLLLLSDGVEYFRSFAVNESSLHILRRIRRGETRNYDYGAGKLECVGGLIGASLFILGLLVLGGFAVRRFQTGTELHTGFASAGMVVQAGGMLVNGFFWVRNRRIARDTHAPLIEMQWRHNRTDTLASGAVLLAVALMVFLQHKSWATYIDPACTLAYVMFAISLYIPVVRNSLYDLMDRTLEEELQIKILRRLAEHFDRYDAFHGVRSRRAGNRIFIDLILSFHAERKVGEVVATISTLRRDLRSDIPHSEVNVIIETAEP